MRFPIVKTEIVLVDELIHPVAMPARPVYGQRLR